MKTSSGRLSRRVIIRSFNYALIAASAVVTAITGAHAGTAGPAKAPLLVQTEQGPIQGSFDAGVRRFAGVRYAAPPVDALRWRPPQAPPNHADSIVDAKTFGSQCPQAAGTGTDPEEGGNEDCLFLNIYAPAAAAAQRLPVMLFIHGGGYTSGTGNIYVPTPMVRQGNVIVVTINYRLGLLGSLALPQLDAEAPTRGSGTYGMQDQQAAMRWVRANIRNFGGDPTAITIFGESAGAAYVCQDVASPTALGLFRGAISESGCGGTRAIKMPAAEAFGETVGTAAGCADKAGVNLACLRSKSPLQISQAAITGSGNPEVLTIASVPMQGGGVLPLDFYDAVKKSRINQVPMIIGSNSEEANLFVFTGFPAPTDRASYLVALSELVSYSTGVAPATIAAEYPVGHYSDYAHALASAMTDGAFSCPTYLSQQLASTHTAVFSYEFSDPDAPSLYGGPSIGPAHGSELPYLFNFGATLTPGQKALSHTMIDYWTTFATYHEPNDGTAPSWGLFAYPSNVTQNLAPHEVKPFPATSFSTEHHCAFWIPYL